MSAPTIRLDDERLQLLIQTVDVADWLLGDALTWASQMDEYEELPKLTAAQAILMACHVITRLHQFHHEENRAQSKQASGEDGEQAVKVYDYLKWLVEKASPNLSEAEESEARKRIIEISGV